MKITIEHEIRPEQLCNFFVTCFEGWCTGWLSAVNPENGLQDPEYIKAKAAKQVVWWGVDEFWASPTWEIRLTEDEENDDPGEEHTLSAANLAEKLQVAFLKEPTRFAEVFLDPESGHDAEDADTLLQLIVLGEVKYG